MYLDSVVLYNVTDLALMNYLYISQSVFAHGHYIH